MCARVCCLFVSSLFVYSTNLFASSLVALFLFRLLHPRVRLSFSQLRCRGCSPALVEETATQKRMKAKGCRQETRRTLTHAKPHMRCPPSPPLLRVRRMLTCLSLSACVFACTSLSPGLLFLRDFSCVRLLGLPVSFPIFLCQSLSAQPSWCHHLTVALQLQYAVAPCGCAHAMGVRQWTNEYGRGLSCWACAQTTDDARKKTYVVASEAGGGEDGK